ncbi:glutathione S-transferase family protein [Aquabacterium sp.]|uniref:glutathione S-transferase family protein n=1 Tax=Aquabacterium sp. TaxID=1872578 RepID=UPI002BC9BA8E|nr:glutathione S-transferase [Aquabacterium sp.]HSW06337.1 glutathione S-transferase [Aquabacterium sp.]
MLQLLGRSPSINVRKVLWLCAEMALPYEHEEWGTDALSLRAPEFLALNPNAMVPVIRDGNFVLWESNAICRYLAARERSELLPSALQARARVEQWMDWQATELNTAWRYAFMSLVRQSPKHMDAAAIADSVANWNQHMSLLDAQLQQTGAFITGAAFTLADIVLGLSTHRWFMTPMARPALPAVAAYYERLTEREGFRRHGRNGLP